MEQAYVEDGPRGDPLRDSIERARAEIDDLQNQHTEAQVRASDLAEKIKKREEFLRVAMELLRDDPVRSVKLVPNADEHAEVLPLSAAVALRGLPRDTYGAVTQAVVRLLGHNPHGLNVATLGNLLKRGGFKIKSGSHEAAVRSALKNLKKRGIAAYDDETARYVIRHHNVIAS